VRFFERDGRVEDENSLESLMRSGIGERVGFDEWRKDWSGQGPNGRKERGRKFRMRVRVVGSDEGESEEEVMIWTNLNPNFNVLTVTSLPSSQPKE